MEAIERAIHHLAKAGVASPEADAWLLLAALRGLSRGQLQAQALIGGVLEPGEREQFDEWVARRVTREPLWHITGLAPFLELELHVGPGVFTPRPETELLAEQAISWATLNPPGESDTLVIDLCAGAGPIGLAIAHRVPHTRVLAVEASTEAVDYLARNIQRIAPDRVELVASEMANAPDFLDGRLADMVVANPPYLERGVDVLDQETQTGDPDPALFGHPEALSQVREVIEVASTVLREGGVVFIEHGITQGEHVRSLMTAAGFAHTETHADLLGRPRFSQGVFRQRSAE